MTDRNNGRRAPRRPRGAGRVTRALLGVLCVAVFALSAGQLVAHYLQGTREESAFRALQQAVHVTPLATGPAASAPAATAGSSPQAQATESPYQALAKQNADLVGWISIEGTVLDYPVMAAPADDEDFYLTHGFDGERSRSGVPFLDRRCDANPLDTNTIVYGHHMKNGTMFAVLEGYQKEDFYQAHPVIRFDTLWEQGEYDIVAAFESRVFSKEEKGFRYYNFIHADDEAAFDAFVSQAKALSLYDTGVTATYGDSLLTLITCDYHTENGRFVVVARKAG